MSHVSSPRAGTNSQQSNGMARIAALLLACVCLQCHLVAGVPVRLGQDIDAILTERPALNPALVHEINSDENITW